MKTLFSIKSFGQLLIESKLGGKVSTCDKLEVKTISSSRSTRFYFYFLDFKCYSSSSNPATLFCVFIPFVFKLWLSGSNLHLFCNLVPLTISKHVLQKNWAGLFDLIDVDEVKWVLLNVATNDISNFRYSIQTEENREKLHGQKNHRSGHGRKGDTTEALENPYNGFWQLRGCPIPVA